MAKVKTIQEKRAEMEAALERLTAFEIIINKLEGVLNWEYCTIAHDDEGNAIEDPETGEWVYKAPDEDAWNYSKYKAFKEALDEIKALV